LIGSGFGCLVGSGLGCLVGSGLGCLVGSGLGRIIASRRPGKDGPGRVRQRTVRYRQRAKDRASMRIGARGMTYCIGVLLDEGLILASDSRTNAGVDNFAKFCKMTVFDRQGDRVIVLLSSGNLAGTQAVIGILDQRCAAGNAKPNLWNAKTLFDVALLVADAIRDIGRRDGEYLQENEVGFNASFIVGGQIAGERMRLFRIYAEGNFIEAGFDTPYFQTGETKYGKPIIDRVIARSTPLADATKCVLVSFDSTMRSNLSVGMPIDLICYEKDSLELRKRRRFDEGDAYFNALSLDWREGSRRVFRQLPELSW
jgi:putative proteasome-type protease